MPGAWWLVILCLLGVSVNCTGPSTQYGVGSQTFSTATTTPEQAMTQGRQAFTRGDFGTAIARWQAAATQYAQQQHRAAQSAALANMAAAYQALGHYHKALPLLDRVEALSQQTGDQQQRAAALASRGNLYIALGPGATAEQYLQQALDLAQQLDNQALRATIFNNMGNLLLYQQRTPEALECYRASITLADTMNQPGLVVKASANAAMAAILLGRYQEARHILDQAWEQRQVLEPSAEAAESLTKLGGAYATLQRHLPTAREPLLQRAAAAFQAALDLAKPLGALRVASYAWGALGHLYETEQRYAEALQLTREAARAAQQVEAPEALYRWHWQVGRLLRAQADETTALDAYRRAVATLQTIRPELAYSYGKPPTTFRETTGALYMEFIDLVLRRATAVTDPDQVTAYLREARKTVESLKAAELRDYFQDDCVDTAQSRTVDLDRLAHDAAVIYPILLPDRLELLVSLPTGLQRVTVSVTAVQVERAVRSFRLALQEDAAETRALRHAYSLYNWLVRPLEPALAAHAPTTLVFVPDGSLHDGQQFLIETYAVAVTPGLDLTNPQPLARTGVRLLAGGVTEAVQGFPALPYVSQELAAIQRFYPGTVLLNQDFQLPRLRQEIHRGHFGMVHLASHGHLASDVTQSFVLTFDGKVTMQQLEEVVGRFRFRQEPLELLTLSACETAAGDDRAALGLAGIAIKAGARSAVATLWRVQDDAAALLVTELYRQLKEDPAVSRAVALQRAQRTLLAHERYHAPFFWSPFLLINNWL